MLCGFVRGPRGSRWGRVGGLAGLGGPRRVFLPAGASLIVCGADYFLPVISFSMGGVDGLGTRLVAGLLLNGQFTARRDK